jgi:GH35 family endo-1,4-beta-xylanase
VRQAITRYRHRVHIWDVVNEAHVQPEVNRGMAGFTREQMVDLTVAALETAHAADPTCFRCINNTGTWADYYMGEHPAGSPWQRHPGPWQQSPYDYLAMLRDAKAQYEVIGLQYYHSGRDMLEWERDLESFHDFGKAIHITEIGFPSSLAPFPGQEKYAYWGGGEGGEKMAWHVDFTETIQADYIESLYTLAYSKPYVEAITYWDFNGVGHDGFIREDGTPKESYYRLQNLIAQWREVGGHR